MMRTHIFCTNIRSKAQLKRIAPSLNNHTDIIRWSIDLEDVDAVLKIISSHELSEAHVIQLLEKNGYNCMVMTD